MYYGNSNIESLWGAEGIDESLHTHWKASCMTLVHTSAVTEGQKVARLYTYFAFLIQIV